MVLPCLFLYLIGCQATNSNNPNQIDNVSQPTRIYKVVLQAGHGNGDSGASFCPGTVVTSDVYDEASLNLTIAKKTEKILLDQGNFEVLIDIGRDPIINGTVANVFVAIHTDYCAPDNTGYKVTRYGGQKGSGLNGSGDSSDQLTQSIWAAYGDVTGLAKDQKVGHFTNDFLYYYALGEIDQKTPGAIIEIGYLSDDHDFLLYNQDLVAQGIAKGIENYLNQSIPSAVAILAPQAGQDTSISGHVGSNIDQGEWIAYFGQDKNIWTTNLDTNKQFQITDDASIDPFAPAPAITYEFNKIRWSRDGKYLAFIGSSSTGDILYIYDFETHQKDSLVSEDSFVGYSWNEDSSGIIYVPMGNNGNFYGGELKGVWQININTQEEVNLIPPNTDEYSYQNPRISDDGKKLFLEGYARLHSPLRLYSYDFESRVISTIGDYYLYDISGDGSKIVYSECDWYSFHSLDCQPALRIKDLESNTDNLLIDLVNKIPQNVNFSRNSGQISFTTKPADQDESTSTLWVIDATGDNLIPIISNIDDTYGENPWSPQGDLIAYASPVEGSNPSMVYRIFDKNSSSLLSITLYSMPVWR